MSNREPFEYIELDTPYCTREFGVSLCTATLGNGVVRKCYNTLATCADTANFNAGTLTLKFCKPGPIPKGVLMFPALQSVSAVTATVNIAGTDPRLGSLGRRGSITASLKDFPYHDRGIDKYVDERIDGTAQQDETGYNPADRGTFLAKLKARFSNYADAPCRYVRGYLENGALVDLQTSHYVLNAFDGPDGEGGARLRALDILDLSSERRSLCPAPSTGALSADINDSVTSATLTPAGVGNSEYPASGRLIIGSEIMAFTRTADVLTLTRAQRNTTARSHSAGDTVQVVKSFDAVRIDAVAADLIKNFTDTPHAFVPELDWEAEADIWAPTLLLTTDITTPTPVGTLLGELADLGVSIWWDDIAQEIGFKVNRPLADDTLYTFTDRNIKTLQTTDRDDDRLTQILFFTKRRDPTRGLTDESNYDRVIQTVDADATTLYGGTRVRKVFTRWLDAGGDTIAALTSTRLLDRFKDTPRRYKLTIDARDRAVGLTDVVMLDSDAAQGTTGKTTMELLQVLSRSEPVPGHEIEIECQRFPFTGRFAFIAVNTLTDYATATEQEKKDNAFLSDGTNAFADGSAPYRII